MNGDDKRLYEALNERITDLAKSYRVLNDHHTKLELNFTRLETRVNMAVSIMAWILAPISGLTLLLRILEIVGVVN